MKTVVINREDGTGTRDIKEVIIGFASQANMEK